MRFIKIKNHIVISKLQLHKMYTNVIFNSSVNRIVLTVENHSLQIYVQKDANSKFHLHSHFAVIMRRE